jgi:hypothetical protein
MAAGEPWDMIWFFESEWERRKKKDLDEDEEKF